MVMKSKRLLLAEIRRAAASREVITSVRKPNGKEVERRVPKSASQLQWSNLVESVVGMQLPEQTLVAAARQRVIKRLHKHLGRRQKNPGDVDSLAFVTDEGSSENSQDDQLAAEEDSEEEDEDYLKNALDKVERDMEERTVTMEINAS